MPMVYIKISICSGFEIRNWIEDQFQSSPKLVGIWTVLRWIFVPNLEIVTSIGGELWHGQSQNGVKWCGWVTRAWLTWAHLAWSEVPVIMVTESFRWETTILKWRLLSGINHLPPACWSTFWKSNFKQQLGCRFDIMDNKSYFLCFDICNYICLDTSYHF